MELRPILVATLALAACGAPAGPTTTSGGATVIAGGVAVVPSFDATRWIPAQPTYAVAAHSVRDAQRAARGAIELPFGADLAVTTGLKMLIGIDLLSPESVTSAGVDAAGGIAVFSENLDPTMVVHLAAPERMKAFVARLLGAAHPSTATVAGVEIATVDNDYVHISWAIDHDWMWLHLRTAAGADTGWFEHSRAGGGGGVPSWQHALGHGKPGVIGFADPHALLAALLARAPKNAVECVHRFDSIAGIDASIDATDHGLATRISLDLADGARGLDASMLAPPAGWAQASAKAPLALEWNVDLGAVTSFLAPCVGGSQRFDGLRSYGVRGWRALLLSYSDETTFSGAVSLDLTNAKFLSEQLDQIPLRKHLESDQAFGPYQGHHLSIPTMFAIDYVLTPAVALIARGDGLLARVASGDPAGHPPLIAVDVMTTAMSDPQWHALGKLIRLDDDAIEHLLAWKALHLGAHVEGHELVIEASAERR